MKPSVEEREAIATICLMAAFADGNKDDAERNRLKEIFDSLGESFSPALYSNVLLGQADLDETAAVLETPVLRQLAYEMAVGICDADGSTIQAEEIFLARLSSALELRKELTEEIDQDGETLASLPLDATDPVMETIYREKLQAVLSKEEPAETLQPDSGVDPMILKYAVLNGGLELLPQSLASMAIVPLQMKMVYRVGATFGYQLDQGHIRELLATVGVGMTSQVVETYARKLVGGFIKSASGKKGKKKNAKKIAKAAGAATGAVMSFASTYALGHVAKVYYAGGRQLSTAALKNVFSRQVDQGKILYSIHQPQVEESARSTDLGSLLSVIRSPANAPLPL